VTVDDAEEIFPLTGDPNEGLIHVPSGGLPLYLTLLPPIQAPGRERGPIAMLVWSTDRPRSAMSSSGSRKLKQNRKYHRTHVTIT
jgi:hypothetical protein